MTKTGNEQDKDTTVDPASEAARPSQMSDMPYFAEALALNPLLGNPAAAMAAAAAMGFGFANQMATAFFGAWQTALDATSRQTAPQAGEPAQEAPVPAPVEEMVAAGAAPAPAAEPPRARAVRKAPAAKPATEKKAAAKSVPAEAPGKAKVVTKKAEAPAKAVKAVAKPKAAAKTAAAGDDLKQISGVGPKLEGLLKDMGVTGMAHVAAWTDKDIARFDKDLGLNGRIKRDDWVGQAKALLK